MISTLLAAGSVFAIPAAASAAPVTTLDSFVEVTNPQYQHPSGNVLWFNPMQSGSVTVRVSATDAAVGVNRVDFPSVGAGWTSGGADGTGPSPYERTYSWSPFSIGAIVDAIAWSNDASSATAPFELRADNGVPGGGSLTLAATVTNAASIDVPFVAPTDAGSGLRSTQMQRRSGAYAAGSCGAWSAWADLGAPNPASPYTDATTADGSCYQYRLAATDNVGNTLVNLQSGEIRIDRTAPAGTIDPDPVGPLLDLETITGTSADPTSGVASVSLAYDGPGAEDATFCAKTLAPEAWSCGWFLRYRTPGVYILVLTVTDRAGNVAAPVTRTVMVVAPPVVIDLGSGNTVAEGATNTYDVVLGSQPVADVTVALTTNDQITIDRSTLTFTPANWNVPQPVVVAGIDDAVAEEHPYRSHAGVVTHVSSSSDPAFDAVHIYDAGFAIFDNDSEGMLVDAADGVDVDEAGATSDTFTVRLASQPTAGVTVEASADAQVSVSPATLTFTPANWNTPQLVTVSAVDDAVDELDPHAATVEFAVSSLDDFYDDMDVDDEAVTVNVGDDDVPAPTGSATAALGSVTEVANPRYQHASGSTIWFNPAHSGSFTVSASASALPALSFVTFPTLGSGWTPGADTVDMIPPFGATYAWSAGASAPGARSLVATSTGGAIGSGAFTVVADATPPAGPTISAQTTVTRDTSAPVSGTAGTDPQSGIGSWRFQRRTAALAGDACGGWGAWSDLSGMNPGGPISDQSLPDASCLQYQLVVADNVGNATVATQAGELRVDRTAPTGTIDAISTSLYGSVTLGGTAVDASTRVRSVSVIVEDRYSICASAPLVNGRWSCDWTIGAAEVGPANIKVTVADAAGHRTTVMQPVTIVAPPSPLGPREGDFDRTPPVVGLARMPLISWTDGVKVKASAYDDRPGVVEVRVEQQGASVASGRFSAWAESFEESEIVPLEDRGETTCFRGVAVDEAGNKATSDPRCTTLPLDDVDLAATGTWDDVSSGGAWLGSLRRTTTPGAALSIKVADANPVIVVSKCRGCGAIRVMHGRRIVGTYSLAANKTLARRLIQLPVIARPLSAPLRIVSVNRRPVLIDAFVAAR